MPIEIKVPFLGQNVDKGTISQWLKSEGQDVNSDDVLVEIEAEKAVIEVESPANGNLASIVVSEGSLVKPGEILGYIAEPGESFTKPEKSAPSQIETVEETAPAQQVEMESEPPWIAVIGGGPGGYTAAIKAAQRGAKVTLIEKAKLGGTCLHTGCMPTKAYLAKAKVMEQLAGSKIFEGSQGVKLDIKQLMNSKDQAVDKLTNGIKSLMKSNRIEVFEGSAQFADEKRVQIHPDQGASFEIDPDETIIAAGSVPMEIPGVAVDGKLIHNTDTIWKMEKVPRKLLVAGSGAVGVEFACIYNALGASVTLVEMLDIAMPGLDREVADTLAKSLINRGIELLTATAIQEATIKGQKVRASLSQEGQETVKEFDCVLVACGRRPEINGLDLDKAGIQTDRGAVTVGPDMRTNIPHIYAIGDIIGPPMLAHAAFYEAEVAVGNIFGGSLRADYNKIPYCVYSFPEVGSVGLTEEQAQEALTNYKTARFPFYANGKAMVCGETEGMVKLIFDEDLGEILGVHIVGEHATELVANVTTAISAELTIDELAGTIMAHPTLSEAMAEAAQAALGHALHLP